MELPVFNIPGVVFSDSKPSEPANLAITAFEKTGKSCLATTLIDWPEPGYWPLVIAADPTGPDACKTLGKPVPHIKIRDRIEATYQAKLISTIYDLEQAKQRGDLARIGSLVIDCASTLVDQLYECSRQRKAAADSRWNYREIGEQFRTFWYRVTALKLPTIWLSWLEPSFKDEATGKKVLGRPKIMGASKTFLGGKVHGILYMEKRLASSGEQADSAGYTRLLHTKPYAEVDAGGRYSLPDVLPAHLGLVMDLIRQEGRYYTQYQDYLRGQQNSQG